MFTGSHLYVSAQGEFDIYNGKIFQRSFGPGVAFGELALLYNTKRLRSISGTFHYLLTKLYIVTQFTNSNVSAPFLNQSINL